MLTPSIKDIITVKQKPLIIIKDPETLELFEDENFLKVLNFLKKGPMSINDLEKSFKEFDEKKSDKSIYRYLNKLIEKKLVIKAGKRICSKNERDLTTETIYMRTAIIFIKSLTINMEKGNENNKLQIWEAIYSLLVDYLGKNFSQENFILFLNQIDSKKHELTIRLLETLKETTLEKLALLDTISLEYSLQIIGWLILNKEINLSKEFEKLIGK